jgi:hypothetical protein
MLDAGGCALRVDRRAGSAALIQRLALSPHALQFIECPYDKASSERIAFVPLRGKLIPVPETSSTSPQSPRT